MLRKKDKMNESSKQTWTLTTTKLIIAQNKYQCQQKQMITEQKTNADNTQMNDS